MKIKNGYTLEASWSKLEKVGVYEPKQQLVAFSDCVN